MVNNTFQFSVSMRQNIAKYEIKEFVQYGKNLKLYGAIAISKSRNHMWSQNVFSDAGVISNFVYKWLVSIKNFVGYLENKISKWFDLAGMNLNNGTWIMYLIFMAFWLV